MFPTLKSLVRVGTPLLIAAAVFASPAEGHAHRSPPLSVAATYWHAEQVCPASSVTVVWAPLAAAGELGAAQLGGCATGERTIWLDRSLRKTVYRWRCTIIVHEYGHLMGFDHTDDPASVMHTPPERVAAGCGTSPRDVAAAATRR